MSKPNPKRPRRLSKNPSAIDYCVERIDRTRTGFRYFETRAEARDWKKFCIGDGADRVRVFRVKYVLVSDTGARKRGKRG